MIVNPDRRSKFNSDRDNLQQQAGTTNIAAHRLTQDWSEGHLTWVKRTQTENWTPSQGGSFDLLEWETSTTPAQAPLYWEIPEMTRRWVRGENKGLILRPRNGDPVVSLASSAANEGKVPRLYVTYEDPPPPPPPSGMSVDCASPFASISLFSSAAARFPGECWRPYGPLANGSGSQSPFNYTLPTQVVNGQTLPGPRLATGWQQIAMSQINYMQTPANFQGTFAGPSNLSVYETSDHPSPSTTVVWAKNTDREYKVVCDPDLDDDGRIEGNCQIPEATIFIPAKTQVADADFVVDTDNIPDNNPDDDPDNSPDDHPLTVVQVDQPGQPEYDLWRLHPDPADVPPGTRLTASGIAKVNSIQGTGVPWPAEGPPPGANASGIGYMAGMLRATDLDGRVDDGQGASKPDAGHALALSVPCVKPDPNTLGRTSHVYPARGKSGQGKTDGAGKPCNGTDAASAPAMGQAFFLDLSEAQILNARTCVGGSTVLNPNRPSGTDPIYDGVNCPGGMAPASDWQTKILRTYARYGGIVRDTGCGALCIWMESDQSYKPFLPATQPTPWLRYARDLMKIGRYPDPEGKVPDAYAMNLSKIYVPEQRNGTGAYRFLWGHDAGMPRYLRVADPCELKGNPIGCQ